MQEKRFGGDSERIYKILMDVEPGESILYDTISESIGRNVQREAYPQLDRAREELKKDEGILFKTIFNVGLMRLFEHEKAEHAKRRTTYARRHLWKGLGEARTANDAALNNEQRIEKNAVIACMGALYNQLKPKRIGATVAKFQEKAIAEAAAKQIEFFDRK